jgi:serine/threonine protein phosphatase PrpC
MTPYLAYALGAAAFAAAAAALVWARLPPVSASRRRVETAQPYGAAESVGRRAYMEDRHVVAVLGGGSGGGSGGGGGGSGGARAGAAALYGVFDGHAGARAAQFCASFVAATVASNIAWPAAPAAALSGAFLGLDAAFLRVAAAESPPLDDGTTALVAVVAGGRVHVANAGDSRAVLVRAGGGAVALSDDHKPNRPDEVARIRALGGTVFFHGVWRVAGVLAVSRSIGDRSLKPYVTAVPDVLTHDVAPGDEALVLASDGLWDVLSSAAVAATCAAAFRAGAGGAGAPAHAVAQRAATTLVRDAILGGSADNVTVLVVDLRATAAAAAAAAAGDARGATAAGGAAAAPAPPPGASAPPSPLARGRSAEAVLEAGGMRRRPAAGDDAVPPLGDDGVGVDAGGAAADGAVFAAAAGGALAAKSL